MMFTYYGLWLSKEENDQTLTSCNLEHTGLQQLRISLVLEQLQTAQRAAEQEAGRGRRWSEDKGEQFLHKNTAGESSYLGRIIQIKSILRLTVVWLITIT